MKKNINKPRGLFVFFVVFAFLMLFSTNTIARGSSVHVKGTVTKTGKSRAPHYRTAPNKTQHDNWSTKGNVNPYNGKKGTKVPKK